MTNHSGTNLQTWADARSFVFDPTTPIGANANGHVITLTSAGGFTAGRYAMRGTFANYPLGGGQGTQTIAQLYDTTGTLVTWSSGAAAGQWSYDVGTTTGGGTSGENLTSDFQYGSGGYYQDPDSPMTDAVIGRTITISGGVGLTAGTYGVATNSIGLYLLKSTADNASFPASVNSASGATWAVTGGVAIPGPATPNTTFTGAINVITCGDSIANFNAAALGPALAIAFPNASSITTNSTAVSGSGSASWIPGTAAYNATVSDVNSASATVVHFLLGANDAKIGVKTTVSSYVANLRLITIGLLADCATLRRVVFHAPLYARPDATPAGTFDTDAPGLLLGYGNALSTVGNGATVGSTAMYDFFLADSCLMEDGLHPNSYGRQAQTRFWVDGLTPSILAAASSLAARPPISFGIGTGFLIGS